MRYFEAVKNIRTHIHRILHCHPSYSRRAGSIQDKGPQIPQALGKLAQSHNPPLFANTETRNNGSISVDVLVLQVIKQTAPLPDHS